METFREIPPGAITIYPGLRFAVLARALSRGDNNTADGSRRGVAVGENTAPTGPGGYITFVGARIASLIPCNNFLSAGQMVASAPRNLTFSDSTK
jgi:hypothetical protein